LTLQPAIRSILRHPVPAVAHGAFPGIKVLFDVLAWVVALVVAASVRYSLGGLLFDWGPVVRTIGVAVALQLAVGFATGLYRGARRYGSFEELADLARVAFCVGAVTTLVEWPFEPRMPISALLVGSSLALLGMTTVRYAWRTVSEIRRRPDPNESTRLLVFGAGERGASIVSELLTSRGDYLPVGIIDDDPAKRNFQVKGVRVMGDRSRIQVVAREYRADALLVAISEVSPELVAEIRAEAEKCVPPMKVKVLAPLNGLFSGGQAIQDLTEEDLLGRRRIDTNVPQIAQYITGRKVLVTGAGGSIGSELCRQLSRLNPSQLIMLDRDESALHGVQLSIEGQALLDSPNLVLADLRDRTRIKSVFKEHTPDVVFHAAALKHLPLLEANPGEAVQSNVWGTQTVLEAAMDSGVSTFVNISTDKAADPVSVLGYTKRIAERLTAHAASHAVAGTFVSVRFGNVLGSRGSVLSTFRAQVEKGEAITVTHPDVTRFFMLIAEAVELVIQAGAIGRPGEVLVLDMGKPIRIADVARSLVERSRKDIPIRFTGLRPAEKLHEVLLGPCEIDYRPFHHLVTQTLVPPLSPSEVEDLDPEANPTELIAKLSALCQLK
jgi:FlaA1/EpsC-like NDP-sugar epimerase